LREGWGPEGRVFDVSKAVRTSPAAGWNAASS